MLGMFNACVYFNTYNHRLRYPANHCGHLDLDPVIDHSANFQADIVQHAPFLLKCVFYSRLLSLFDPFFIGIPREKPRECRKFSDLVRCRLLEMRKEMKYLVRTFLMTSIFLRAIPIL